MIKKHFSKIGLLMFLSVVLVFTSSVSAAGTTNDVSRVEYFTIQSNVHCGDWGGNQKYRSDFNFNINNLSDISNDVTVYLYKKDGTLLTTPGNLTGYGFNSEIVPGTQLTIGANQTVQYSIVNGYNFLGCEDRPTHGKIVIHSNHGLLMATGEMTSRRYMDTTPTYWETYNVAPVIVNGGDPF